MKQLRENHNKLPIDAELTDYFFLLLKLGNIGVGKKTQQLRAFTTLVHINHLRWHTTTCNSSSRGSHALWLPQAPAQTWWTHSHADTYICVLIKISKWINLFLKVRACHDPFFLQGGRCLCRRFNLQTVS